MICFRLFILFTLFLGLGCSVKQRKKPEVESEVTDTITTPQELVVEDDIKINSYQLGNDWDRGLAQVSHPYHNTVFRAVVGSPDGKISSNFILLEKISNTEAYFIGTVHSLPNSCLDEGISFRSKDRDLLAECTSTYSIVPETDIVIFSVNFYEEKDLEPLSPVVITNERVLFGDRLRFFGIDFDDLIPGYYPLITDSHKDCRLISRKEEKIADPDKLNTVRDDTFWSYAVTCDVKHGDSGGMFVNREGELVGILWTGAFPKKEIYSSEVLLNYINEGDESVNKNLWKDFNYITPAYRVRDHLERLKKESI